MPRSALDLLDGVDRVLLLGAHSDDIEIGCGGTVLCMAAGRRDLHVTWVVLSGEGVRRQEAEASARAFTMGLSRVDIVVHSFPDGYLPSVWSDVKGVLAGLKALRPDLVLTHRTDDAHQDHRLVAEMTWNLFRDHQILEYEIPKYDGDLGRPNVFVELDDDTAERKWQLLDEHFPSQRSRQWFDRRTFDSLMRIRGVESNARHGLAEAFTARKLVARVGSGAR